MKVTEFLLLLCLSFFLHSVSGQGMSEKQREIMDWLDAKKPEFQNTRNDSLFITNNSDAPYRYTYLRRGDEPEEVEEEIFKAKPGTVVGPFLAGSHNYLFKVVSLDSLRYKMKIRHIFIKPAGNQLKDTLDALSLAKKSAKTINSGGNFEEQLKLYGSDFSKYATSYGIHMETLNIQGELGWIWAGSTLSSFDTALLKARKGESVTTQTPYGVHVIQVLDKGQGYYKVKLISLVKKLNK
jgi:peptidyl-prolyl cis-trans isomerase D